MISHLSIAYLLDLKIIDLHRKYLSCLLQIENFTNPTIVQPGKLVSPLSIRYENSQSDLVLSTTLRLYTNASIFTIPVHSYTGKLKVSMIAGINLVNRPFSYSTG